MTPILLTLCAAAIGFTLARNFVRRRLRFVDAVHSPLAPWAAGLAGTLAALPLAALPMVGIPSAVVFGVAVGLGARSGSRALQRLDLRQRRLAP
jgi:hypothetical protein